MVSKKIDKFLLSLSEEEMRSLATELNQGLGIHQSSPMSRLELILTEDCPFRCDYCFVRGKNNKHKMDEKTAKAAIDFAMQNSKESNTFDIILFGGEPLMEFNLIKKVVEYAETRSASENKSFSFAATTNGYLINEEIMQFFQSHHTNLLLSIDGNKKTQDAHRRLANGGPTFDKVFPKIELMLKYQPWVGARMTVNPDTVADLAENVRFLHEAGINQFMVGPNFEEQWAAWDLNNYATQMKIVAEYYLERKAAGSYIRIAEFEETPEEIAKNIWGAWGCEAGRNKLTVTPSGKFYGCSKFVGQNNGEGCYCLGDLEHGITAPLMRAEMQDNRSYVRGKCFKCDYAAYCTGGCPANNLAFTGSIFMPSDLECFFTKQRINLLRLMPELPFAHRTEEENNKTTAASKKKKSSTERKSKSKKA